MRKFLGGIVLLALISSIAFMGKANQNQVAYNPYNLVRFHVLANSDFPEDQAIKREVRDVLLAELEPTLADVKDRAELEKILNGNLERIQATAENYLKNRGIEDEVKVEYGVFPFPVKGYGSLVLPAGEYEALKVVIGQGKGSNWWCVLFPPLCFVNITEGIPDDASITKVLENAKVKESEAGAKQIKFKLKILELFQKKRSASGGFFES